jgi:hypothetical protein
MRPAVCMCVACAVVTPFHTKTVLSRWVRSALTPPRKVIEVRTVGNETGLLSLGRRSPRGPAEQRGDCRFVFDPRIAHPAPSQESPQQSLHCVQSGRDAGRGGPRSFCVHGGTHVIGFDPADCSLWDRCTLKRKVLDVGVPRTNIVSACVAAELGTWFVSRVYPPYISSCCSGTMEIVPGVPASHEAGAVYYIPAHSLFKPYCMRAQEQKRSAPCGFAEGNMADRRCTGTRPGWGLAQGRQARRIGEARRGSW